MNQASLSRMGLLAAGGGIGGVITFLLLDPALRREELAGRTASSLPEALLGVLFHATYLGVVVGVAVGVCLVLADELRSGSVGRALRRGLMAAAIGAFCGAIGGIVGQIAFAIIVQANVVVGRTLGWCLVGAAAGVCPGAASGSARRLGQGALGGIIGGGFGGFLFDFLAALANSGTASVSRAVGLVLMGAGIGLAVALVEEAAKEHWLSVLTGDREGRAYILAKPRLTLGRDELADIPCFGDSSVQKLHASLAVSGEAVQLTAASGALVLVNAQPVAQVFLRDGDLLGVGKHRLRFHSRHGAGGIALQPRELAPGLGIPAAGAPPAGMPGNWYDSLAGAPGTAVAAVVTRLEVLTGPHAGEAFALSGGPLVIGRDPACSIPLAQDAMVSRRHAQLTWDGASWRIEDLGSTNGLFVNGQRVSAHPLSPGDQIGIGGGVLRAG